MLEVLIDNKVSFCKFFSFLFQLFMFVVGNCSHLYASAFAAWSILASCCPREYPFKFFECIFFSFTATLHDCIVCQICFLWKLLLNLISPGFQHFQAAIGKDIIDVTLISRRCTRRNGSPISYYHFNLFIFISVFIIDIYIYIYMTMCVQCINWHYVNYRILISIIYYLQGRKS